MYAQMKVNLNSEIKPRSVPCKLPATFRISSQTTFGDRLIIYCGHTEKNGTELHWINGDIIEIEGKQHKLINTPSYRGLWSTFVIKSSELI